MRKFKTILYLTIFIAGCASSFVALAQDNANVSNTNSTIIKGSSTDTKTEKDAGNFRVGPTVSLRPLDSEIDKSADGIVELFLNNPNLNDCTLEVDMAVEVPSDIYIYAQDGGMSGGAGTVTGHFTVPPGSSRTITMHIKGQKIGTYPVHFSGMYWPGNNKDKWNPISLDSSFNVKEPSNNQNIPQNTSSANALPGLGMVSILFIIMTVYILTRTKK